MTPGTFVRVTSGPFAGMTGRLVGRCIGDESRWWVRLTSTGQHLAFAETELQREQTTSEIAAEQAAREAAEAARAAMLERLQAPTPRKSIRERLRGQAA